MTDVGGKYEIRTRSSSATNCRAAFTPTTPFWLRRKELNLILIGYEPSVLPYTISAELDPIKGVEPLSSAWQADVLPLNHIELSGTRTVDRTQDLLFVGQALVPG